MRERIYIVTANDTIRGDFDIKGDYETIKDAERCCDECVKRTGYEMAVIRTGYEVGVIEYVYDGDAGYNHGRHWKWNPEKSALIRQA